MSKPVFSRVRKDLALAVLTAAGAVGVLSGCNSDEATYRPQPRSTPGSHSCGGSTQASPAYTPPPPSTPAASTPAPQKPAGQMSCGKGGKCG